MRLKRYLGILLHAQLLEVRKKRCTHQEFPLVPVGAALVDAHFWFGELKLLDDVLVFSVALETEEAAVNQFRPHFRRSGDRARDRHLL